MNVFFRRPWILSIMKQISTHHSYLPHNSVCKNSRSDFQQIIRNPIPRNQKTTTLSWILGGKGWEDEENKLRTQNLASNPPKIQSLRKPTSNYQQIWSGKQKSFSFCSSKTRPWSLIPQEKGCKQRAEKSNWISRVVRW